MPSTRRRLSTDIAYACVTSSPICTALTDTRWPGTHDVIVLVLVRYLTERDCGDVVADGPSTNPAIKRRPRSGARTRRVQPCRPLCSS